MKASPSPLAGPFGRALLAALFGPMIALTVLACGDRPKELATIDEHGIRAKIVRTEVNMLDMHRTPSTEERKKGYVELVVDGFDGQRVLDCGVDRDANDNAALATALDGKVILVRCGEPTWRLYYVVGKTLLRQCKADAVLPGSKEDAVAKVPTLVDAGASLVECHPREASQLEVALGPTIVGETLAKMPYPTGKREHDDWEFARAVYKLSPEGRAAYAKVRPLMPEPPREPPHMTKRTATPSSTSTPTDASAEAAPPPSSTPSAAAAP